MRGYQALSLAKRFGRAIKRPVHTQFMRIDGTAFRTDDGHTLIAIPVADLLATDWVTKPQDLSRLDKQIEKLQVRRREILDRIERAATKR